MTPLEAIINLVKRKIPYDDWPEELKIAGVSDDLKGDQDKLAFPFGPIPHWISLDLEKPEEEQICIFCDCYTGYWSQGYLLDGKVEWMGYGHIPNDLIPTHFLIPPHPPEPSNE